MTKKFLLWIMTGLESIIRSTKPQNINKLSNIFQVISLELRVQLFPIIYSSHQN